MSTTPPARNAPSPLEKTNQLERILCSAIFRQQVKPANFLECLVENELAGIELDEHALGIKLFERRADWITADDNVVRQNKLRLRKLLETYYSSEGLEDRINIELEGYRAVFSYNPRNPVERNFRLAMRHVATEPRTAFSLLNTVMNMEPEHAEAQAAWAEVELWRPFYGNETSRPGHRDSLLLASEQQAGLALRMDNNCWRAHVVAGALHCCRMEWPEAEKEFNAALANAPVYTRAHPWYAAFLLALGKTEEALELTAARASAPSDTPWPLLTHATFLYAARRFRQSEDTIGVADGEYDKTWLSHVLRSCIHAADYRNIPPLVGMMLQQTLPNGTEVYTGLALHEHLHRLGLDHPDYKTLRPLAELWVKSKVAAWDATDEQDGPFSERCICPSHLALGWMALDDPSKAVEMLSVDFDRGHPLMAWLHLWPILDPLREMPSFQSLTGRMNLPYMPERI